MKWKKYLFIQKYTQNYGKPALIPIDAVGCA